MKKGIAFVFFIFGISIFIYPVFTLGQTKVPVIPTTQLPTTLRTPTSLPASNNQPTQSVARFMGGRIVSVPAFEIYALESTGFICPVMGKTLSIHPMGSPAGTPTSYYVSYITRPQTATTIRGMGQLILAKYTTPTYITCTHPSGATTQVPLHTINLYGTSR